MSNVENEISFLKNKVDEHKANREAQFKDVENEIKWFKNESKKLGKTFELQKKEIQMLKSKKNNIIQCNYKSFKFLSLPHYFY